MLARAAPVIPVPVGLPTMVPVVRPMPVRADHVRAVPVVIAMMVLAVRLTMAPADLATRVRVVPPMMDPQDRLIQDLAGRAMEGREALVILAQVGRVTTARRFAGEAAWSQCAFCQARFSVPDRSIRADLAKKITL